MISKIYRSEENKDYGALKSEEEAGAFWVETFIQQQCLENRAPTVSIAWQSESNDLFVSLSIIAPDGKRASKTFSRFELIQCPHNKELQEQMKDRILHLLRFLHPYKQKHN